MRIDARLPLEIRPSPPEPARPDWLLLLAADIAGEPPGWLAVHRLPAEQAGHPAACACCGPARGGAPRLLGALFQARARGETGFFRGVVLCAADEALRASLAAACGSDPYVFATFHATVLQGSA